MSENRYLAPK